MAPRANARSSKQKTGRGKRTQARPAARRTKRSLLSRLKFW